MQQSTFTFAAADGAALFVYRWLPDGPPRQVVQIVHGMAEHAGRYRRFADALTAAGFAVYAHDQRGHGHSVAGPADFGWVAERGGWSLLVDDAWRLNRFAAGEHGGAPAVLFGHSMGSFVVQHVMIEHGAGLAGAVLSASDGAPSALARAGRLFARLERLRLGKRGRSRLLQAATFGAYNRRFAPTRTDCDWLSRDPAEVDRYVADPACGFVATAQFWVDLLDALSRIADPARQRRIPPGLPVLIVAGADDPLGDRTHGLQRLIAAYRDAGLRRVEHVFYPEGRHELLNDICRDQVTADLIDWLERLPPRS